MKKVISILLSVLIVLSSFSFSAFAEEFKLISANDALKQYEKETGEKVETNRYYFLMPDGTNGEKSDDNSVDEYGNPLGHYGEYEESWYNEYSNCAGIYWWDSGVYDPLMWTGYLMDKADADSVYYADVPKAVTTVIFNNAVDGGMDKENPIYYLSHQTVNVPCEYYDPGESDNYPNGTESFDNMIFVVDPDLSPYCDIDAKHTVGGEWYYYYGNGCYGTIKNGGEHNCIRDDHGHKNTSVKEAIAEYEAQTGEKVETNRYYFLMPNGTNGEKEKLNYEYEEFEESWYNDYANTAGIYWWDSGIADPERWPGYTIEKDDSESVFYADVPTDATTIIFNNFVDGGMDPQEPIYKMSAQTINVPCEYYDPGENDNYPNGTESFDNMIYVIHPGQISVSEINAKHCAEGEWYYYYGDGCYGIVKNGDKFDCLRDDHDHRKISVDEAINRYEKETGKKVKTNRYYFLMPNGNNGDKGDVSGSAYYNQFAPSWYNEYGKTAGVYWWGVDSFDPPTFPGYSINESYTNDVYSVDLPVDVKQVIWTNYVFVSMDTASNGNYPYLRYTKDCTVPEYAPNDSGNWIYVVDPDTVATNEVSLSETYDGKWYHYYGAGCYGTEENGDYKDCIRADHDHSMKSVKEAIAQYENEIGEKVETNRYYFLMPDGTNGEKGDDDSVDENGNPLGHYGEYEESWYNELTDRAGVYWWGSGIADPERWPGYYLEKGDSKSVYYADIPTDVTTIIFNNAVDGGMDTSDPIYHKAKQTYNIPCEYYDAGESVNYPDGTDSFDNMIFVGDPDLIPYSDISSPFRTLAGEWYYYYGDGCYGFEKDGDYTDCLRDDHDHSTAPVIVKGDVDGDGVVSILDATAIQRDIAKIKKLTAHQILKADLDNDGEATILDATAIQLKIAKID